MVVYSFFHKKAKSLILQKNQRFLFATPTVDRLFNTCKIRSFAQINLSEQGTPDLSEIIPLVNADCREKPCEQITFNQVFTGNELANESWKAITPNDVLFFAKLNIRKKKNELLN